MAQISWPTRDEYQASTNYQTTAPAPIPLESATIQLRYPGRSVIKAEFSNRELSHDFSPGEWAGSVTIAGFNRNSPEHTAIRMFLEEMNEDPGNNWTLVPWEKPSIFSIASTLNAAARISILSSNNSQAATMDSVTNGVGRIVLPPTPGTGNMLVVSPGEHFGLNEKTYLVKSATFVQAENAWDVQTVPALPNSTTSARIYKRVFLPARIVAGQSLPDVTNASFAGPFAFSIVEFDTD